MTLFVLSGLCLSALSSCGSGGQEPQRAHEGATRPAALSSVDPWAVVLDRDPDPTVIPDLRLRDKIVKAGLPWRVRSRSVPIVLVLVPAGEFTRGVNEDRFGPAGRPVHNVRITQPFYISEAEVTVGDFRTFDSNVRGADSAPAIGVKWDTAKLFAERHGLRLPTEAEWEYACAGGSDGYYWEGGIDGARRFANVRDKSAPRRFGAPIVDYDDGFPEHAPVKKFLPNPFGLYDMVGNVWEWCEDWYSDTEYGRAAPLTSDPKGPSEGRYKVIRGGGATSFELECSCQYRGLAKPNVGSSVIGFRVCKTVSGGVAGTSGEAR